MANIQSFIPNLWATELLQAFESNTVANVIVKDIPQVGGKYILNTMTTPDVSDYEGTVSYGEIGMSAKELVLDQRKVVAVKVDDIEQAQMVRSLRQDITHEMAYKIAGSMAFKDGAKKADPCLLEPIMKVEVTMPEEYMGDVIGDINSRRGRIEGMDDLGGGKIVRGFVPLSEMFGYSTDLRSRTQGRGNYSMFFEKYEPVPKSVQEKVLAKK